MRGLIALFVLAVVFGTNTADNDDSTARLLASKNVLNPYIVEGKELTVEYSIYNVGGGAAFNVKLNDESFPEQDFDRVIGMLNVKWERIAPGSNVSHVVILKPTNYGVYNFTSGELHYQSTEDSKETIFGHTSAPGHREVIPSKEYERRFSPHMLDWGAFAVMTLPSLGIPFLLWWGSKSKYEQLKPKKN
ncbi:translocon-associated protein subunit beta-like [Tubulanus polymorphus]|uniref:translocon-associated protein subunit beta-like n=1 Tax=Tubulanus polymorphus TaxID=672921 RepID=UPI003DA682B6